MNQLIVDEYIKNRLDDQIKWYENKSSWNQKWYKRLKTIELAAASSIPFLIAIAPSTSLFKLVIGVLGILITMISGLFSINQFHENWINYRITSERLLHEKYLFITKASPYNNEDSFNVLVEHIEKCLVNEITKWKTYSSTENKNTTKRPSFLDGNAIKNPAS